MSGETQGTRTRGTQGREEAREGGGNVKAQRDHLSDKTAGLYTNRRGTKEGKKTVYAKGWPRN